MKKNKIVLFTLLLSIIGVVGSTKAASVNEESRSFRIENSANSELVQSSSSIDNGKGIRFTNWTSQFQNFKKEDKIKILLPSGKFNGQTTTIRVYVNGKLIGALTLTYGEAYAVIVFNTNANSGDISQFISHFGNFNFGAIGAGGIIDIGGGGTTDGGTINASSSSVVSNSMSSNRNDDNIGGIGSVGSIGGIGSLASIANSTESRSSIEALSSSSSKIISIPASSSSTSRVSSSSSSDGKGISIHYPNGGPGPVIINSTMSAWKGSSSRSSSVHGTSSSISSIKNSSSASSSVTSSTKHDSASLSVINSTSHDNISSSSVSGSSVKSSSSSSGSINEGKGIHRHSWHISSESELSSHHHHHHHHDHGCDGNHHHHHHNSSSSVKKDSSVNGVSQSLNSQSIVSSKSDSYSNENDHNENGSSMKNENSSSKMSQSSASSNVSRESRSDKESVKVIVVPGKESNNSSSSHLSLSKKSSSVNSVKRSVRKVSNESSKKMAVKSPANAKNNRRSTKAGSQSVIDRNGRVHLTKQQVRQLQKRTHFENSEAAKAAREAHRVMNSNNHKVTVHPSTKAVIRNGKITIRREEKNTKKSTSHLRKVDLPIRGILPATRMDKNTWLYSLIGLLIMIISGKELLDKKQK